MQLRPRYRAGDTIGGRYEVHDALMGGMGEVYLCLDLEQKRPIALKTFQARILGNHPVRQAFDAEVKTWIALEKHPNIVRCYSIDLLDYQPFMTLEWVVGAEGRGTDLRGWLRQGSLNPRLALDFAIDICRGLTHAAQRQPGIVHQDLKPENVLIAQDGTAKITDWGLATVARHIAIQVDEHVPSGSYVRYHTLIGNKMAGTPPYMAPEQWCGEDVDQRTDIYAVGCILYEMLMGQRPYMASTARELRHQHLFARPPTLKRPGTPASLAEVIESSLAKRRGDRYATAQELLVRLSEIYKRWFAEPPRALPATEAFTAADYNNRGIAYLQLRLYDEGLADLQIASKIDKGMPHPYVNRGILFADLKRYDEALIELQQAIGLNPAMPGCFIARGSVLAAIGRDEDALHDFDQAVAIDPKSVQAWRLRGNLNRNLKRFDAALRDYDEAAGLAPRDVGLVSDRAMTLCELGRYGEAVASYEGAFKLGPPDANLYVARATLFVHIGRSEEAISDLTRAHELGLDDETVESLLGNLHAKVGKLHEKLRILSRVIELDSRYAPAYEDRADAFRAMGRYREAILDFAQCIELRPNEGSYHNGRGVAYHEIGRFDEALADFDLAAQLEPENADPYFNMGLIRQARGQLNEALRCFEIAARLGYLRGAGFASEIRRQLSAAGESE